MQKANILCHVGSFRNDESERGGPLTAMTTLGGLAVERLPGVQEVVISVLSRAIPKISKF